MFTMPTKDGICCKTFGASELLDSGVFSVSFCPESTVDE